LELCADRKSSRYLTTRLPQPPISAANHSSPCSSKAQSRVGTTCPQRAPPLPLLPRGASPMALAPSQARRPLPPLPPLAPPLAPLLSPPTPAVEAPFKKAPFKEAPLGRAIGSSGGGGPMHLTGLRAPSPFPRNPDPRTAAAEAEEHSSCPGRGPSLQPTTTPPPPPSLSLPRSRPPSAWRRSQGAAAPAEARPPASSLSSLSSSPSSPSQASKSLGASRGRVEAAGRGLERRSAKPRHKPAALPASDGSVIDV